MGVEARSPTLRKYKHSIPRFLQTLENTRIQIGFLSHSKPKQNKTHQQKTEMPFYTRHPLDTLLLSDPFFTSFTTPSHHNTPHNRGEISSPGTSSADTSIRAFSPNFDVHETPKEYVLEGELPGLEEKKRKESGQDEEQVKYWVSERTVGSFQRSFSFPGEINQDGVKATLDNGILKIVVPKKEKRGTKRIEIH